jgi:Meiotically up-regulated gene family
MWCHQRDINISSDPSQSYGTALILSGFDATNNNSLKSTAAFQLNARWPANYGDVYFEADGCLYDSSGNKIFNQCSETSDPNNSGPTTNPYCAPAPPSPSQVSGNNKGSSLCLSITGDSCKFAAKRFQDNTVYHQYTSSVGPTYDHSTSTAAEITSLIFPVFGLIQAIFGITGSGCTVIWACDSSDAYNDGMTGAQIKDA